MKRRSRNRNRRIENGGIIDGGVATSKHFPPEKDSDPIYEAEARNKRAELRAKKDTIAELEDTRPNPVHELEDGRR